MGLVFRAIGYQGVPLPGIPFDAMRGVIPNQGGRIVEPRTGEPVGGEYVVGWIKRGPQGIIGTNKPDSQETARMLLEDLAAGRLDKEAVPSREALGGVVGEGRGRAVGARRVGAGAAVADPERGAGLAVAVGAVGRAVVGED